ncbi:MAG: glycoside hydrolase family 25 protein [Lachnospiraceae bacterium]|nr:glycoside hydrolase family 25 protein [Lachnospiraceae bacterium]
MANTSRRSRRKQMISLITNIIFCLITLTALTGCIILVLQNYGLRNESRQVMNQLEEYEEREAEFVYSQADLEAYTAEAAALAEENREQEILAELKARMESGDSTAETLRDFFPEDVVVYSDGRFFFFPILDSLKKHNYVYDNFVEDENKEIVYVDDTDVVHSLKGIDVSRHQEEINWKKVAQDGVSYAFIRGGYRGYSEGKILEDDYFQDNIEGALDNGIEVGVYFYTQAVSEEEAVEEAEFLLDLLEPYDVTYPVVLDLEDPENASARTADMTKEEHTKAAIAFLETVKDAGYTPMIYGNLKTFMLMLDLEQMEGYDKWFAYYNTPVYFPYEFTIWQYSSKGSIDGIKGDVDMNVGMKDYAGE